MTFDDALKYTDKYSHSEFVGEGFEEEKSLFIGEVKEIIAELRKEYI